MVFSSNYRNMFYIVRDMECVPFYYRTKKNPNWHGQVRFELEEDEVSMGH